MKLSPARGRACYAARVSEERIRRGAAEVVGEHGIVRVERVPLSGGGPPAAILLRFPDWVMTVAVDRAGRFVMVRQHRFGIWAESLEPPGGVVDPGERPEQTALRELREETGYGGGVIEPLGWVHPNPALQDNRCHAFLVRDAAPVGPPGGDPHEEVTLALLSRAELEAALAKGQISHALAVVALMRALARLGP